MVTCENCKRRVECVTVGMNISMCHVAHESLHQALVEFHRRIPDPAIVDIEVVETHMDQVDTKDEVTITESIGVEILPLLTGKWKIDNRWWRVDVVNAETGERKTQTDAW